RHQYFDTDNPEELKKRSAIDSTEKFTKTTPILLIHGTKDWRVEVSQTLELAMGLYKNQVPFEMTVYEGDDHSISQNRAKVNKQIVDWINKYTKS
uniref:alpha/beta hydrolase family protein n=1 Tax=Scytonema sp. HK-05 TaxID=1137095 RepID=UPI000966BA6A